MSYFLEKGLGYCWKKFHNLVFTAIAISLLSNHILFCFKYIEVVYRPNSSLPWGEVSCTTEQEKEKKKSEKSEMWDLIYLSNIWEFWEGKKITMGFASLYMHLDRRKGKRLRWILKLSGRLFMEVQVAGLRTFKDYDSRSNFLFQHFQISTF